MFQARTVGVRGAGLARFTQQQDEVSLRVLGVRFAIDTR